MKEKNLFSLAGKTALVAGASRGIGLAIARAMAYSGARTLMAARSMEALQEQASLLTEEGYQAEPLKMDIANPDSVREAVDGLPDIDVLVNVAGVNIRKPFQEYRKPEYEYILATNLHGVVELTQQVGEKMILRGKGGKVIMIGSLMSVLGLPFASVYAMSKSALAGLTRVLAAEWGRYDIQVNCIAPGFILTDLNREMWQAPEMADWRRGVQANPDMGVPDDVAPLAVFLAGRGSDYITGQVIAVDGGYTTTAVWPFTP